jgi:hypothetical protein
MKLEAKKSTTMKCPAQKFNCIVEYTQLRIMHCKFFHKLWWLEWFWTFVQKNIYFHTMRQPKWLSLYQCRIETYQVTSSKLKKEDFSRWTRDFSVSSGILAAIMKSALILIDLGKIQSEMIIWLVIEELSAKMQCSAINQL